MNLRYDITSAGFVNEGAVILRELGYEGIFPPIPDEESAVVSLLPARDGNVYGLTKGRQSHLFVYHIAPVEDCVLQRGIIAEDISGGDLVCASDGVVYGMAFGGPAGGGSKDRTFMFTYDPSKDSFSGEASECHSQVAMIPCPFEGKKVSRLAIDPERDIIYGLLLPENVLFSYEIASGRFTERGQVGTGIVSKVLCFADDGCLYGVREMGDVFRYSISDERLHGTGMAAPCGKGKEYVSEATALVFDPERRAIYGGTLSDGCLFKIDLNKQRVVCLGKPTEQRPIRCLTVGKDGKVFGTAGEPGKGICHLFRYDPESGDMKDLGILRSTIVKSWVAHEIDAICTNRNGHIVLGENDRMAHLLIYYPPVEKR